MEEVENIKQQNRLYLIEQKNKSDDDFEKNHVYISAGILALSITFIEKIAPLDKAVGIWTLIFCWVLLVVSLLINFISHQVASRFSENQISLNDEIDDVNQVNNLIDKNNRTVRRINWWSVGCLIGGISFLVLYCSLNAYHINQEIERKVIERPRENDENKGRTNIPLQQPKPIPQPANPQPAPTPSPSKPEE